MMRVKPAEGALRGRLERDADMSRYVTWRAGGRAKQLYAPVDLGDLCVFLRGLPEEEPVYFVGLGSNLLVRDGGIQETVLLMHGALTELRLDERRQEPRTGSTGFGLIYAEAGVATPKVARYAVKNDLIGAEFLAGIPGTVGGALAMNAGCYGQETWGCVTQVLTVNRQGETRKRTPRDFRIGYRQVAPEAARDEWFAAAWFLLQRGDGQAARKEIEELLQRRAASQPLQQPNAGSVFRNPRGDHAARLIESCGLKGLRIGNAQISEKHANFIVNLGGASASDIETLIDTAEQTVADKTGVRLQREVRIIGEK